MPERVRVESRGILSGATLPWLWWCPCCRNGIGRGGYPTAAAAGDAALAHATETHRASLSRLRNAVGRPAVWGGRMARIIGLHESPAYVLEFPDGERLSVGVRTVEVLLSDSGSGS